METGARGRYAAIKGNIDYRGRDVTPNIFLDVIQGNTPHRNGSVAGTGRVLESGPDDDVFIYFADHGGVGILAFPQWKLGGVLPFWPREIHADELIAGLQAMYDSKMSPRPRRNLPSRRRNPTSAAATEYPRGGRGTAATRLRGGPPRNTA